MKRYIAYSTGAAAGLLLFVSIATAQTSGHDHAAAASAGQHAMMMAMKVDMQAKQKTLDDLIAQMNASTGPEKVDRIAAVITAMAAMHKDMCAQMMNGAASQPAPAPDASDSEHAGHHRP